MNLTPKYFVDKPLVDKQFIEKQITNKKIVYQRFLDMTHYTLDQFWIDILIEMSMNKLSFKKISIQDQNTIVLYQPENKLQPKIVYDLPKDNKECFKVIFDIFKNKLLIHSPQDISILKKISTDHLNQIKTIEYTSWKDKELKKHVKQHLIIHYIFEQKKILSLTKKQTNQLFKLIQYGVTFKILTSDCFVLKDNQIDTIHKLEFNGEKFYLTENLKQGTKFNRTQKKKKGIESSIENYIKKQNEFDSYFTEPIHWA